MALAALVHGFYTARLTVPERRENRLTNASIGLVNKEIRVSETGYLHAVVDAFNFVIRLFIKIKNICKNCTQKGFILV